MVEILPNAEKKEDNSGFCIASGATVGFLILKAAIIAVEAKKED